MSIWKFAPQVKLLLLGGIMLGGAYLSLAALTGDSLPVPDKLKGILVPSGGGASSAAAVEVATAEMMARMQTLKNRPPVGGESLGRTADDRFWLVSLDLGPKRQRILCVVEPAAPNPSRRLVHFQLVSVEPSQQTLDAVAKQAMWKASATGQWKWEVARQKNAFDQLPAFSPGS